MYNYILYVASGQEEASQASPMKTKPMRAHLQRNLKGVKRVYTHTSKYLYIY